MINGARGATSGESAAYLLQLNGAMSKPEELARLVAWMNGHDMASVVSDWSAGMAPEIASRPAVAVAPAVARYGV